MPDPGVAAIVWIVLLGAASLYTLRAHHPDTKPLAAVLIFAVVFSASAVVLMFTIGLVARLASVQEWLAQPAGAVVYLLAVVVPAFLLARWQIRRPPRRPPPID